MTGKRRKRRPRTAPGGPAGKGSRTEVRAALFAFAAAAVALCAAYAAIVFGYGRSHGPGSGREVEIDWPSGLSAEAASSRLVAAGLVRNQDLFAIYLRATFATGGLRAGAHLLTDDLSPAEVVLRLGRSARIGRAKVTIPEGFNRFDMAKRLQNARICGARAFLEATRDLEGFLFPATYDLAQDSDPREIAARMKAELDKRFDKISRDRQAKAAAISSLGWGVREIVTLASIVEKEAAVDEERPLIASVFFNRLKDPGFLPKRLQSDPTSAYGCVAAPDLAPSCRSYAGKVTPEMNADEANPYGTYRHDGLPPGPICNPGERSIEAVFAPAETKYFYFVARGEGRHVFSETFAQHAEAVRKAR